MTEPAARTSIEALRAELDRLDAALVEVLAHRTRVVDTIGALKEDSPAAFRDPPRERAVLDRVAEIARSERLDPAFVTRLFRDILDHSIRCQEARLLGSGSPTAERHIVVGYQGAEGAYGHQAARRHFSPLHARTAYRSFPAFRDMLRSVQARDVDYAVLPVENTTAGAVHEAYDLLAAMDLAIVGEIIQPIDHCLIGTAAVELNELRRIYSHPQALAQCSEFLARMPWCQIEEFANTALAVRNIAERGERTDAAIASEEAARLSGLPVLARDIANQRDNFTRFVVVADTPMEPDARIACKTSIMFVTRHERGALVRCLNELADRGLNLTRIESRPRPGSPWEYQFYVDFEGNARQPAVQDALRAVQACSFVLKVFGSYPSRTPAMGPADGRGL